MKIFLILLMGFLFTNQKLSASSASFMEKADSDYEDGQQISSVINQCVGGCNKNAYSKNLFDREKSVEGVSSPRNGGTGKITK